ncbi:hypothetical protein LAUMK191_05060 [Mycobacterium attenuatum]|uniref:Uncharacterized protein n=1 Tax=Mycobacterium attenuatum TaxID=2341086 RepID=A0A498QEJ7_9MYCO|nr:hypothetical protein LAUMK136_05074 [Mycobacterium attenuatum]VBA59523.1 hypothetical protein LAUMK191_05060 [Mycobacterium attenuatum]VBA61847.1 hypothetical protein LAUMK41_05229 [Mycobacterium attenuatum]
MVLSFDLAQTLLTAGPFGAEHIGMPPVVVRAQWQLSGSGRTVSPITTMLEAKVALGKDLCQP